jgi:Flp pilus assembly protein TadD
MRRIFLPPAPFLAAALLLGGCAAPHAIPTPPTGAAPPAALTPENAAALYLGAVDGLIKQQRYGAALAFLNRYAVSGKNPVPRYWLLRGEAELGLARPREAATAFTRLNGGALAAQGWNGQGHAAAAQRDWRAAAADFRKAQAADPANPAFLNNLAFADLRLGESEAAIGFLRQAHELDPHNVLIRDNLLIALTVRGDRSGTQALLMSVRDPAQREKLRTAIAALLHGKNSIPENPS